MLYIGGTPIEVHREHILIIKDTLMSKGKAPFLYFPQGTLLGRRSACRFGVRQDPPGELNQTAFLTLWRR